MAKREIANLLNDYFVHIADSIPEFRVEDYGEDYANHPSIKAIHEHRGASAPACLSFHRASETEMSYYRKGSMYALTWSRYDPTKANQRIGSCHCAAYNKYK